MEIYQYSRAETWTTPETKSKLLTVPYPNKKAWTSSMLMRLNHFWYQRLILYLQNICSTPHAVKAHLKEIPPTMEIIVSEQGMMIAIFKTYKFTTSYRKGRGLFKNWSDNHTWELPTTMSNHHNLKNTQVQFRKTSTKATE